jgi:hypothetical protein
VVALATAVKKRPAAPKSGPDQDLYPFWVGEWPRLTGRQAPAWESKFVDGVDFYHGDRLGRFAHKIGERQMPWQWSTMRNILAVRPDGLWAHPDVCLIIPRQNGKTELAVIADRCAERGDEPANVVHLDAGCAGSPPELLGAGRYAP